MSAITTEPWLTTRMAASYLNCCVRTLYRRIQSGEIKAAGLGRNLRFRREDLDAFLSMRRGEVSQVPLDDFISRQMGKVGG